MGGQVLAVDDVGAVVERYIIHAQLERDLEIALQTQDVHPVCLGQRQFGNRCFLALLLTNTWPPLAPKQNLLSSENTTYLHSTPYLSPLFPMSSGLTPLVLQMAMA
ncbi:hypothetical protein TNCV_3918261 [Trichonephila clavipes]|nr:hypothetical protein TNCV_3918261 [Trichonephila clavipes]